MRLIDADVFKQQIAGMAIVAGYSPQKANRLCKLIDEQPTAYDIDKVIKNLNEWTFNTNIDVGDGTVMNHNLIVRDVAIDIVKAGGENDD